jgi:hypothetical protein
LRLEVKLSVVTAAGLAAQCKVSAGLLDEVVESVVTTYLIVTEAPSFALQVILADVLEVSESVEVEPWYL